MFQPRKPVEVRLRNIVELMVDDDGTAISLKGFTRYDALKFEYHEPGTGLIFTFETMRNRNKNEEWWPVSDFWDVFVSLWALVPAVLEHPELDAEKFKSEVFAKIEQCLLTWPLDPVINTIKANKVTFVELPSQKSLKDCVLELARERRRRD